MKVYDTSGQLHKWSPTSNPRFNASSHHVKALALLKSLFPLDFIIEEAAVPGERIFLDFFIPSRHLVVEVNGEQHYKFNSHFYATEFEFQKAKNRDNLKKTWCEINNFDLVTLDYNNHDEWESLIIER